MIQRRGMWTQVAVRLGRAWAAKEDSSLPGLDEPNRIDRLKALFGAVMTLVLTVLVMVLSLMEYVLWGYTQISLINLAIFLVAGLIIMLWLVVRGTTDRFGDLLRSATAPPSHPGETRSAQSRELLHPGRVRRFFSNLWIPVTFQFAHAGWLVYVSGGLGYSQYYMVPAVMMLIGQSLYPTPSVDLLGTKPRNMLIYAGRVVRAYWYPVTMVVVLFATVVLLQERHPLVTRAAPEYEHYFTMLVELISGIFVVHFTRRADQTMFRRAPGAVRL